MPEEQIYKRVTGTVKLQLEGGSSHTFELEGVKPPQSIKALPEYVAQLVRKSIVGMTELDENDLKGRLAKAQEEIGELKKQLAAKDAPSSKRGSSKE